MRSSILAPLARSGRVIYGGFALLTSVVLAVVGDAPQRLQSVFTTGLLLVLLCVPDAPASAQARVNNDVHAINMEASYSAKDFAFLRDAVDCRTIVQLGESIHLTDEFPRVRVRLVRDLHENMGFDVISLEGSQVNAWLGMERLYAAPGDTAAVSEAQAIAWFPLWNTSAIHELMQYVAASQSTSSPLYLSSFAMQAGESRVTGDSVFRQLFRALSRFAPAHDGTTRWEKTLIAAKNCSASYSAASADSDISGIRGWVPPAAVQAARVRPASHVAVLRTLPDNLR
ncbi:MAG: hypothetical protein ABI035_00235 [Gemmatimonadaceae bacterium]